MTLRRFPLGMCLSLSCGLAWCQTQSITGTVTDSVTAGPVSRARVTLFSTNSTQTILTDATGAFTFGDVPPGKYSVSAERTGYLNLNGWPARESTSVEPDKKPGPLLFQLQRSAAIAGTVVDEDGLPLPFASIQFSRRVISEGRARVQLVRQETSNDLGEFHVSGLEPGRYLACAAAQASSYQVRHNQAYSLTCFPDAPDPASADWLELRSSEERQLAFHVKPISSIRVSGSVERETSDPMISVSLHRIESGRISQTPVPSVNFDNKTSKFEVSGVTPGDYMISADANEGGESRRAVQMFHAAAEEIRDIRLILNSPSYLFGTVRMQGAAPGANQIGVQQGEDRVVIFAQASGTFRQPVGLPGEFTVQVLPPPKWIVQSVMQAGADLRDRKLSIGADRSPEPIDIVLTQDGGALEVTLAGTSEKANPLMKVIVLRRSSIGNDWVLEGQPKMLGAFGDAKMLSVHRANSPPEQARPLDPGKPFTVPDLHPGDYLLFALPAMAEIEYSNPEVIQSYREFGQAVSVRKGETTRVTLPPVKLK